jgi:hypothetical protein
VRKHPRAALNAAGAGTAYAVKSVVKDGADVVSKTLKTGDPRDEKEFAQVSTDEKSQNFTPQQKEDFVRSLTQADRDALLNLAEKKPNL